MAAGRKGKAETFGSAGLTLGQPSTYHQGENQQPQQSTEMMPDSEMEKARDDDDEDSKSGSDYGEGPSASAEGSISTNKRKRKKRYNRHTQHQIQEMEAFFRDCPHPDDKQRRQLGRDLGLEPLQVKFWFQNKRTQMKCQHERQENSQLRAENERLRIETMRLRQALNNASCTSCGAPAEVSLEDQVRIENAHLQEEIQKMQGIAPVHAARPMVPFNLLPQMPEQVRASLDPPSVENFGAQQVMPNDVYGAIDLLRSMSRSENEGDKPIIAELALTSMDELIQMATFGEPLWVAGLDGSTEVLNQNEYFRMFPTGIGPKPNDYKTEATRGTGIVVMNHINLLEILMDANQWSSVFSSIILKASTKEVLSTGVGGSYNGALQVMSSKLQLPSPLVPTREFYFVRYCRQHAEGTWAVVDVSLDSLRPNNEARDRRRPSGCLIQELPNGCTKVTWIEHVEVKNSDELHSLYKILVDSGLAFGANRWIATLDRQCDRIASIMASNIPVGDLVVTSQEGRRSMLKLAERMVSSFCSSVSKTTPWTSVTGGEGADQNIRVMTRNSSDPRSPPSYVLSASTSFWLPAPPQRVFDYLRDESSRNQWDILSNGGVVQEMAHIAHGRDPANCVSLLRVYGPTASQTSMLLLQESCNDMSGCFMIYAPVDLAAMDVVLSGGDPNCVAVLPSGFAIFPDGPAPDQQGQGLTRLPEVGSGSGSLLTIAFQVLMDSLPSPKLSLSSISTINSLISCTVDRIKAAVVPAV